METPYQYNNYKEFLIWKNNSKIFNEKLFALMKEYGVQPNSIGQINEILKKATGGMIQEVLKAKMDNHLGYQKHKVNDTNNSRNGTSPKKVIGSFGKTEIEIPRDRNSEFEPQIIQKHQKDISHIEQKIIYMYSIGTSTRDIVGTIKEIYGFDLDPSYISKITDKILPQIDEFRTRALDKIYPMIFIDGIRFKPRESEVSKEVSVYIIIGYTMGGMKEILGFWRGESETSKYWLTIFNDLKTRGIENILMVASDNHIGISEAINAAFPKAKIQKCLVHQIRNSIQFVNYKHQKEFVADMKKIYQASSLRNAEVALDSFEEKWSKDYAYAVKSWRNNFEELVTFFGFPNEIRRLIYTTNVIENVNRNIRSITKNKSFPNNNSLSKIVFLSLKKQQEKYTKPIQNWGQILNQLAIFFWLKYIIIAFKIK